jgi:hypothetical protein
LLILSRTCSFNSLSEQHRDRRRRSMLLRKWSREVPRRPSIPAPLNAFDAGGLRLSKSPSFAKKGEKLDSKCRFRRHGPGWRKAKRAWQHTKGRGSKVQVGSPTQKRAIVEIRTAGASWNVGFQTLTRPSKSLRQATEIEPGGQRLEGGMTTVLRYVIII